MRILLVGNDTEDQWALGVSLVEQEHEVNFCLFEDSLGIIVKDQPGITCIDLSVETPFTLSRLFSRLKTIYGSELPATVGLVPHETSAEVINQYYELGFDLVLEQPLSFNNLSIRLTALQRRLKIGESEILSPHLLQNINTRDVYLKNSFGSLLLHFRVGQIQFILLQALLSQPRRVWYRPELIGFVSNRIKKFNVQMDTIIDDRLIDGNVYRLRENLRRSINKLDRNSWSVPGQYKHPFIQTERFLGYYFLDVLILKDEITLPSQKSRDVLDLEYFSFRHRNLSPLAVEGLQLSLP